MRFNSVSAPTCALAGFGGADKAVVAASATTIAAMLCEVNFIMCKFHHGRCHSEVVWPKGCAGKLRRSSFTYSPIFSNGIASKPGTFLNTSASGESKGSVDNGAQLVRKTLIMRHPRRFLKRSLQNRDLALVRLGEAMISASRLQNRCIEYASGS